MVRRFNAKQKSKHVIIPPCKYYFSIIPSKNIHNSISPELQEGHIDELNEQSGFFTKLEESILKEGIINPILVSIGWAPPAIINRLPKEAQDNFENEFNILLNVCKEELLEKQFDEKLVELILLNRQGKINVKPGFDGEYGKIILKEKHLR